MSNLDARIADLEHRIVNAATLEGARVLHGQLDELVARRDRRPPSGLVGVGRSSEYQRGYQAGYHAGARVRLIGIDADVPPRPDDALHYIGGVLHCHDASVPCGEGVVGECFAGLAATPAAAVREAGLDVERLTRALAVVADRLGAVDEYNAADVAAEYARLAEQPTSQD